MMLAQFTAVGVGAAVGAWLRWGLSMWLNPRFTPWPLGTLAANLIGGYLIGFAIALFEARTDLSVEWRLVVITGFLGGLTTFSTFSGEVTLLLARGQHFSAIGLALMHLLG